MKTITLRECHPEFIEGNRSWTQPMTYRALPRIEPKEYMTTRFGDNRESNFFLSCYGGQTYFHMGVHAPDGIYDGVFIPLYRYGLWDEILTIATMTRDEIIHYLADRPIVAWE